MAPFDSACTENVLVPKGDDAMRGGFTLSEIVRRTGAGRRAVQLWADGGVMQAIADTDRAGTGVHRLFDEAEVQIAALLVPLANLGIPIGHLKVFSGLIRPSIVAASRLDLSRSVDEALYHKDLVELMRALSRGIRGMGENFLLVAQTPCDLWIKAKTDNDGQVCIDPSRDLPEPLRALRPAPAVIVLNLSSLLFGVID